jgi:hypothetical protein
VELAFALNLAFEAIEKITLELKNFPATQARHVQMIALRPAFVKVFLTLQVHEVQFIDQPMPFEQLQSAIDGHPVNSWIDFAGLAKKLAGVEMLLGSFHNAEDRAALAGHAQPARHKLSLQSAGLFSFRKRHTRNSIATSLTRARLYTELQKLEKGTCSCPLVISLHLFFHTARQLLDRFRFLEYIQ